MAEPHWVSVLLFVLLVLSLLGIQVGTFVWCMEAQRRRQLAGWFAGLMLGLLVLASSSHKFVALPINATGIYWGDIITDTIRVSWLIVALSALLSVGLLKFEEYVPVAAKVQALVMLLLTAFVTYSLAHVYLIREWNGVIFSWFVGVLLGWALYRAFIRSTADSPSESVAI